MHCHPHDNHVVRFHMKDTTSSFYLPITSFLKRYRKCCNQSLVSKNNRTEILKLIIEFEIQRYKTKTVQLTQYKHSI